MMQIKWDESKWKIFQIQWDEGRMFESIDKKLTKN